MTTFQWTSEGKSLVARGEIETASEHRLVFRVFFSKREQRNGQWKGM